MASGNHISCAPCMFDDVTKDARKWCTNCEEGLCEDCENLHRKSKTSRNHKVITIEDYRKIENVSFSQVCEHHGETFEWFCKSHDEVLCVNCVPSKHNACSDVISISANLLNSRQSTAFSDLEETIEETLRDVKHCIKNREYATKEIECQELAIKTMVLETRTKVNSQLDKLQEKLLDELRFASLTCKSKYMKILQKLKSTEEMLTKLREQTKHMKQFSSDIQVFLGTRQTNKRIVHEIELIEKEVAATKDYEFKVSIDGLIEKLCNEVGDFGKLMVSESATNLDFREPKFDQAQIEINVPMTRDITDIKLQLIKSFQMTSSHKLIVSDCIILPNGHILIANDTKENYLIEYSDTGEHIRDIRVSGQPYATAVIDRDRIVVTYGDTPYIEIMNNFFSDVEKISLHNSCWGVCYADRKLYVVQGDSIQVLDLSGKQLKTLKTASENVSRIYASRDKIFYTDWDNGKLHCCNLNGDELWQLKRDSISFPQGVTIDNCHHVYVVCFSSDKLTIIQQDGNDSKTLLTESDGLNCPNALFFDKDKRTLLICNEEGKVLLYKIV